MIETQRTIDSILDLSLGIKNKHDHQLGAYVDQFYNQRVDFSVEFPNANNFKNGIVIEIDGSQHQVEQQRILDDNRDRSSVKLISLKRLELVQTMLLQYHKIR